VLVHTVEAVWKRADYHLSPGRTKSTALTNHNHTHGGTAFWEPEQVLQLTKDLRESLARRIKTTDTIDLVITGLLLAATIVW
jgi:hypothetical protein